MYRHVLSRLCFLRHTVEPDMSGLRPGLFRRTRSRIEPDTTSEIRFLVSRLFSSRNSTAAPLRLMLQVVRVPAPPLSAAHQGLTHLAPRETLQPRSCPADAHPHLRAFCGADAIRPPAACLPARSITRRTSHAPHCARRFTARTAGPRAAARAAAAAAVGAGLAAGAARACPPPASFPRAGQAAAPSPAPAVPQNQRFSGNSPLKWRRAKGELSLFASHIA